MKVALLESNHVALSIARSLARQRISVDLLHLTGPSIADWSRSVNRIQRFPHAVEDVAGYCVALTEHLRQCRYDLLIPVSDAAVEICRRFRDEIGSCVTIAMSHEGALAVTTDKLASMRLAKRLSIPVPAGCCVASIGSGSSFGDSASYPCYLKPSRSVSLVNNHVVHFKVRRAFDATDLQRFCYGTANKNPVLVQEEVAGIGAGVYLIADHGKILAMACQYRLHEPRKGGPGSYRVSDPVPEKLAAYSTKLIEAVGYHGVAMIEFKGNPVTQEWRLMEINSRFWGSLPLTLASGLDMPYWLVQLFSARHVLLPEYRTASQMRQRDLKRDLGWLFLELVSGPDRFATLRAYLADLKHLLGGKERIDYLEWRDPIPFLVDWLSLLKKPRRKAQTRVEELKLAAPYLLHRRHRVASGRRKIGGGEATILFVCWGNIYRSPFADAYLRQKYEYPHVQSAGFYPVDQRISPPDCQQLARDEFGVDLTSHRSRLLDEDLLEWANLIVVMDYRNLAELKRKGVDRDAVLLGSFSDVGSIRDPQGASPALIQSVLHQIAKSVDQMFSSKVVLGN